MEIDALRLILETKEVQDATGLALHVVDQLLIPDLEDSTGRGIVDGFNQPDVVLVEPGDVALVVGSDMPFREHHLEVRPAAVERVPTKVDDLRVRQDHSDDSEARPVVIKL